MKQYEDQIIQAIVQDLPPDVACADILLCPGPECGVCTLIISTLENFLPSNTSEVSIYIDIDIDIDIHIHIQIHIRDREKIYIYIIDIDMDSLHTIILLIG